MHIVPLHKLINITACQFLILAFTASACGANAETLVAGSQIKSIQNKPINAEQMLPVIDYKLLFSEFSKEQVLQIQLFMRQYSAYVSHSLEVKNSGAFYLTYRSQIQHDMLINNLEKTAEYLGFDVIIRSADENISLRLVQLLPRNLPYQEW